MFVRSVHTLHLYKTILLLVFVIYSTVATMASSGSTIDYRGATICISQNASRKEIQAAKEVQRYLYAISQIKLTIRKLDETSLTKSNDIIIGTRAHLPKRFNSKSLTDQLQKGTDEAFVLSISPKQTVILANEPIGALYGAYTFLEKFGIGFYLGGDVLPGTHQPLTLKPLEEFWSPKFPIRGSVIWYNFLNGPICWNIEDYKYYFDQMVKIKANLVSFPEYGHGLTNYEKDGKLVPGGPFPTSENYGWGSFRGMKTSEFGFGTGEFFTGLAYGSKVTLDARDDQDAIRRSQELFAQAAQYAEDRGIKICLGFQLDGMPDQEHITDVTKRLEVLTKKYPQVHYIWFWQTEAGSIGWSGVNEETKLTGDAQEYQKHFTYLSKLNQVEGARMTTYIKQTYDALKKIAPDKEMVISGWGGDKWDHFTDLFQGFDELLPKDIIFSALDNIDPTWEPNVSAYYAKVSKDRQTWAIPWWESDGGGTRHDQFFPQCNTKPFSILLPDVLNKGCKGLLGIHWRVRDCEDVSRYMTDYAWNPEKTSYTGFWNDFATRCFGEEDAPEMAKLLMELDGLGPRWTGGSGQHECQPFAWVADKIYPKAANLATMQRVKDRLVAIREKDAKLGKTQFLDRLDRIITTIDCATIYDKAAVLLEDSYFTDDRKKAGEMMAQAPLGQAMRLFTNLLLTEGDWGILATMNVKAFAAYELRWKQKAWSTVPDAAYQNNLPFQVTFKLPNTIVNAHEALTVQAIVVGGNTVKSVELFYRELGKGKYKKLAMVRGFRNVYRATIPATDVTESGIEYFIEAKSTTGEKVHLPKGLPSVTLTVN